MKIYQNRKEVLEDLNYHLEVEYKPYGTWKVKSYLDDVEVSYLSHNEEDSIGIFDGEKYYPQDYNEWLIDYAQYEIEDYEHYHEEELKELFEEWCQGLWSDSSNENNYEPDEDRYKRLSENLFDLIIEDDRVFGCINGKIVVLTEEEKEFLCDNNGYRQDIYNGNLAEFQNAFNLLGE